MGADEVSKSLRKIAFSAMFLGVLAAVAISSTERFFVIISCTLAVLLGIPFLLLSVADYGRAVKIAAGGDYGANRTVRWLSHYRAAGGAICMAAAGTTLFRNVPSLFSSAVETPLLARIGYVFGGLSLLLVGFIMTGNAYAVECDEDADDIDS